VAAEAATTNKVIIFLQGQVDQVAEAQEILHLKAQLEIQELQTREVAAERPVEEIPNQVVADLEL
jgi:hypothetical protein